MKLSQNSSGVFIKSSHFTIILEAVFMAYNYPQTQNFEWKMNDTSSKLTGGVFEGIIELLKQLEEDFIFQNSKAKKSSRLNLLLFQSPVNQSRKFQIRLPTTKILHLNFSSGYIPANDF